MVRGANDSFILKKGFKERSVEVQGRIEGRIKRLFYTGKVKEKKPQNVWKERLLLTPGGKGTGNKENSDNKRQKIN